jgi:4'-phosphopantetheinyl transferase EntD
MALAKTAIGVHTSASSFGTGPYTTGAFTPPSNSLLVVCITLTQIGVLTADGVLAISDSLGLTWTQRRLNESLTSDSEVAAIFTAPVGTAASMTVTVDCGATNVFRYIVHVFAFAGYDTTTPVGGKGGTGSASGATPTTFALDAAPATSSYILSAAISDSGGTITEGTGWTAEFTSSPDILTKTQSITGSASTTVTWNVLTNPGGGVAAAAIEIRQAPGIPGASSGPGLVIGGTRDYIGEGALGAPFTHPGESTGPGLVIGGSAAYIGEGALGAPTTSVPGATIGQATETDTAQIRAAIQKIRTIGLDTETDLSQAARPQRIKVLGLDTEADLSQATTRRKVRTIGLDAESDLSQAARPQRIKVLGLDTEADLAQATARRKLRTIGLDTEADLSQTVAKQKLRSIALDSETDLSQPTTRRKLRSIGLDTETDLAQAIAHYKARALALLAEADTAQTGRAIRGSRRRPDPRSRFVHGGSALEAADDRAES